MLKQNEECKRFCDGLEEAAANREDAVSVERLMADLSDDQRKHVAACGDCREAVNDLARVKALFSGAARFAGEERPWFASRVMAVIASRERDLAERVSPWVELPRFASLLTWVSSIALLLASAWLYEKPISRPISTARVVATDIAGDPVVETSAPQSTDDDFPVSSAEQPQ